MLGFGSDNPTNAIELLKSDHDEVEKLFDQYEDAREESNAELKGQIVAMLCKALTVHAQIEEELFYPAVHKDIDDVSDLVDEATVEHHMVRMLVEELESAAPDDLLYDAKVKVLSEYVKHHVREEEGELFPLARRSEIDLDALGLQLMARKEALATQTKARRRTRNGTPKPADAPKTASARGGAAKTGARKATAHGRH
ncbi:MAG TPA: hemerythrin domain-containing protein [Casimicrobiaceae bacterium]|jgi:hemerythrin superfamily protein|nr:hemerythrin domain-containing protein [Casimicrobiaceae bacterium]